MKALAGMNTIPEASKLVEVSTINLPVFSEALTPQVCNTLERMFRDPRVLEKRECRELIARLRQAVELAPQQPGIRVLLGMALCVDLQVQDAMEELRTAVKVDPNCFIARLKFGELLMRLRICDQAEEQTHQAALLAVNAIQSELARKQAATIRTMRRDGIDRGGYWALLPKFMRPRHDTATNEIVPVLIGSK
jgi:hypothetical protein